MPSHHLSREAGIDSSVLENMAAARAPRGTKRTTVARLSRTEAEGARETRAQRGAPVPERKCRNFFLECSSLC